MEDQVYRLLYEVENEHWWFTARKEILLRYLDARNDDAFVGKEAERYWMGAAGDAAIGAPPGTSKNDRREVLLGQDPSQVKHGTPGVDLYVGGTEHAVLHLLYARFWHKVLFDLGHVSTPEPFYRLVNQGLILGEDGQKMSKSRGNVVNPDDVLSEYGAAFQPRPTPPSSLQQQQLADWSQCRRQLVQLLVRERNHAEHYTHAFRHRQSQQLSRLLEKQISQCDQAITKLIAQDS